VLWLALWLPLSAVLGGVVTYLTAHFPESTAWWVRISNYLNLVMLLPAFILVYRGGQQLYSLLNVRRQPSLQAMNIAFIVFAALYVLLTLQDPARHAATTYTTLASYYQPDWLIITTLIIPQLIMWYLGFQAVYYIYLYAKHVKGTLYKASLTGVAAGIAGVVVATVVLRCFQSLSSQFGRLSLSLVVIVVYLLLIIISAGYILINRGAKSLQKIEEL
jgi:hypothetical protein